ncbi:site-specific integrase [Bacillus sp. HMF5848]|uniref:site-specific integrase n=1 Tax=Bacillus sp. HMF5848 TaxID=2495421 RepID=UPI000F780FAE|nr:site-specific integrase [Bacillus sp. HMF5848]RSK28522.1 site-specific integrase [Bacillus sp. HMF5848]
MSRAKRTSIKEYVKVDGKKYYYFKIYIGVNPLTGKPDYTTRRGFRTKKEAELALARMKLEISKGTFRKQTAETFQDVYDLWIEQYKKKVEESTFVKTAGIFRNHILPKMGDYRIAKIDYDICEKHVNEWAEKLKSVRIVKSYASKILDYAIKKQIIQTNPFSLVEIPQKTQEENIDEADNVIENFYNKEQLLHFFQCMKQESNTKAYVLFHLLAYSGMRKGEALALNWNDINFNKKEIRINKALSQGTKNRLYFKPTKTEVPRTISMDSATMEILREWKKKQRQELNILGYNSVQPKQLVFSNKKNEVLQPSITTKWLNAVIKKYQLPFLTTHGFRHTHCSLLVASHVSIKEAQVRLGHKDFKTTMNVYAHVSKQANEDVVTKLESYMAM